MPFQSCDPSLARDAVRPSVRAVAVALIIYKSDPQLLKPVVGRMAFLDRLVLGSGEVFAVDTVASGAAIRSDCLGAHDLNEDADAPALGDQTKNAGRGQL